MRFVIAALAWLALTIGAVAQVGQAPSPGQLKPAAAASYTGPLDVAGYTSAYAYWGLRCASTSYTGNVADIWDSATGSTTETLLTCSSGGVLNETINSLATTCAVSCKVKILYNQAGTGSGRDMNWPSLAQAPILIRSGVGLGAVPSMFFDPAGAAGYAISTSNATTQAQAITISAVARGNTFAFASDIFSDGNFGFQLQYNAANSLLMYNGTSQSFASSTADGSWSSIQAVYNAGSSSMNASNSSINSSCTPTAAGGSVGTAGIANTNKLTLAAGSDTGAISMNGYIFEVIVIAGSVSAGNQATQCANQRAYGGGF